MIIRLLTEHHLESLSLKKATQAHLSLHLSKCYIVGNHMSRLKCYFTILVMSLSHVYIFSKTATDFPLEAP